MSTRDHRPPFRTGRIDQTDRGGVVTCPPPGHRCLVAGRSAAAALLVGLFASCGGAGGGAGTTPVIAIDGSSTVFPIAEAVAEEYQRTHPTARVTVGVSGTGGGFKKFCAGEIDISDASRPIRSVEIAECTRAGIGFIELPVAYDGITVVVHPDNDWVDTLTPRDLERMWAPAAQGVVTRWNRVRPEWPDRELHLFGPGVDSGTFDYFTLAIVGQDGASRGDFTSSEDDNVLVQGVATDELALGFFGYAYYRENRNRLKLIPIDDGNDSNGAGAIAPSPETVRNRTYQPLVRPVYIYVNLNSLVRADVVALVDFILHEGADLVREVGYVPLTSEEYVLVRSRFKDRVDGTMYEETAEMTPLAELLTAGAR